MYVLLLLLKSVHVLADGQGVVRRGVRRQVEWNREAVVAVCIFASG